MLLMPLCWEDKLMPLQWHNLILHQVWGGIADVL